MIKHLNASDLMSVAGSGAGLEVDGAQFSAYDLRSIALRLSDGATLKIHNSKAFNAHDLRSIALGQPGQVIFC